MSKKSLADKFREAGFEVEELRIIVSEGKYRGIVRAVNKFVKIIENAHKDAANSKLHFGSAV